MGNVAVPLKGTYNTYAGADIAASITIPGKGHYVFGELQTITYSIHRDKRPVRACGFINPKGYTRGPRTIAGSLIFTVFDKHMIYRILQGSGNNSVYDDENGNPIHVGKMVTDELPPFDVTITFANEYGSISKLSIYGITIVDEGQVMSIEDMLTENTMTYVATDIDLMSDGVE